MFSVSLNIFKFILSNYCDLISIMRLNKLLNQFSFQNGYSLVNISFNYMSSYLKLDFNNNKIKIKIISLYNKKNNKINNKIVGKLYLLKNLFNNNRALFNHSFDSSRVYEFLTLINNH